MSPIWVVHLSEPTAKEMHKLFQCAPNDWIPVDLRFGLCGPSLTVLELAAKDDSCEIELDVRLGDVEDQYSSFQDIIMTKDLILNFDLHQRMLSFFAGESFVQLQEQAFRATNDLMKRLTARPESKH